MTTAILAPEIAAELPPEPYPGLRPFEPAEWAIFFGREPPGSRFPDGRGGGVA